MPKARARRRKPFVLIVDDESGDGNATKLALGSSVNSRLRPPNEVEQSDLDKASLVLVDLKLSTWPQRDKQPTSLRPQDGIALTAVLRSNLPGAQLASPTAFALRSGKLHELSGSSVHRREHVVARLLELEWVFSKADDVNLFAAQVKSLAQAVDKFPRHWPTMEKSRAKIFDLLQVNGPAGWRRAARDEVENASPPEDVIALATNGMAVLRWILHEVLPYPTFLLDDRYLAARLRVDPSSLREQLHGSSGSNALKKIRQFEYRGILSSFLGRRWWRAGIEHWIWSESKGHPQDADALAAMATRLLPKVRLSTLTNPVIAVDDLFRPTDDLIELRDAVQVNSDDWPAHADSAWVSLDQAKANSTVRSQVVLQDRAKF